MHIKILILITTMHLKLNKYIYFLNHQVIYTIIVKVEN